MSDQAKESEARRRAFIAIDHICAWHGVGTSGKESWIEEVEKQIIAATASKDAEIERLKAGGCARDQRTTQFCAEAVALQQEVERLKLMEHVARVANEDLAKLVDKAMAVMATYINVPEALALRERWEKLKNQ